MRSIPHNHKHGIVMSGMVSPINTCNISNGKPCHWLRFSFKIWRCAVIHCSSFISPRHNEKDMSKAEDKFTTSGMRDTKRHTCNGSFDDNLLQLGCLNFGIDAYFARISTSEFKLSLNWCHVCIALKNPLMITPL